MSDAGDGSVAGILAAFGQVPPRAPYESNSEWIKKLPRLHDAYNRERRAAGRLVVPNVAPRIRGVDPADPADPWWRRHDMQEDL